ncbi:MAG: bifunctional riboflavin kinase/FAD synthetase [Anaerolineae bacterium]|nr:bifunctional riboflavin kinase/FAD synthetase [Anaerolineae bacterium]
MQHVYRLEDAQPPGPAIVAIGVFDGVHRGHQHLLKRLVQTAQQRGCVPTVLTFFPHPDVVLGRASGRYYLVTTEQRARLLGDLGVELVVTHPFDITVRRIRAADFVDQLLTRLNLCELWVGPDFALGYKREGTVDFLREQGEQKDFGLEVIGLVTNDGTGKTVSSRGIRDALAGGDVEQAAQWLGRPYRVEAEVVPGDGRGRQLGFPTANMDMWEEQVLPMNGVYAGWAHLNGESYMAVANVGRRPTFDGGIVRLEVHLLDFDRDIYGWTLAFDVVTRLRAEQRFASVDALVAQVNRDIVEGRKRLSRLTKPPGYRGK